MRSIRDALKKTRRSFFGKIVDLLKRRDPALLSVIGDLLISGDVGLELSEKIVEGLKGVKPDRYLQKTREILLNQLKVHREVRELKPPIVFLFVGVNGVGKTTTIGKIGYKLSRQRKRVLFSACDTYRTGAQEQLKIWADMVGADIVSSQYGSDPGAVAFDSFDAAVNRKVDYLLIDTAGRLHTKENLMEEMKKIKRILNKKRVDVPQETLLVVDATTGQNIINQAEKFNNAIGLTGLVLTKMDGSAKGGAVLTAVRELQLPILYIGTGEHKEDIVEFSPDDFVDGLLSED